MIGFYYNMSKNYGNGIYRDFLFYGFKVNEFFKI